MQRLSTRHWQHRTCLISQIQAGSQNTLYAMFSLSMVVSFLAIQSN